MIKYSVFLKPLVLIILTIVTFSSAHSARNQANTTVHLPLMMGNHTFAVTLSSATYSEVTDITEDGSTLYITQKDGRIFTQDTNGSKSPFMDISDRICYAGYEQGLLSMAFHPDSDGRFYLSYTGTNSSCDDNWQLIVSEFNVDDLASETRLFTLRQDNQLHNGGGIAFHPLDGNLYLGVGDDSGFMVAQEGGSYKGKLVSLDVDAPRRSLSQDRDALTAVPTTTIAKGLRNPWRFGFDDQTGDIYIGDVGDRDWEEINVIPNGSPQLNFGWPCFEGPDEELDCASSNMILPIYYYGHRVESPGCSVTAGDFYRNPSRPDGRFIFSDYCTNEIYALSKQSNRWVVETLGALPEDAPIGLADMHLGQDGIFTIGISFGENPLYEIYIP